MATPFDRNTPAVLATLAELGEWMAYGFYEAVDQPWPQAHGRGFRRLYENMEIVLAPDRLLAPDEPLPRARTMASHGCWVATSLICDFEHSGGMRVNRDMARDKQRQYPRHAAFIDALCRDLEPRLPHFGGYTHSNPDIRRVVDEGFLSMEAELHAEQAAVDRELAAAPADSPRHGELAETQSLFLALADYAAGVRAFHARTLAALRAKPAVEGPQPDTDVQGMIARAFENAFLRPAANFVEGLLAVHFAWLLDGHDSIGRFDQALGGLFERDLASGVLDLAVARRLLDEVWRNFERFNGWNLQIGGYTPEGKDGFNALTRECLDACRRNPFRRPNVAFRITRQTPEAEVARALEILGEGSGRPALYNDDRYISALSNLNLGLTPADAREVGFGGCTETMIAGMSNVGSLDGEINLARCLVLALHDGGDPLHPGQAAGPHTGALAEFATFDAFLGAVKRQIQWATDELAGGLRRELRRRFHEGDPKLYRTLFTRDCVRNRKSFEAGGARYNWSVITYQGIANLIDSLAAIRRLVYQEHRITPEQLITALLADFKGYETIRQQLLTAPKFGNDLREVDELGRDIIGFAWRELLAHETPRGGRFLPSCILFVTYYGAGLAVAATPDGRLSGTVLTDSAGPTQGRDSHGPTAMLNSVARLPLELAAGTPVVNLRLQKRMLANSDSIALVTSLLRTYFANGGLQLQLSALDRETMVAAQDQPDAHRDLIVRIGGYSEYFVALPKELQDSVIARTEHGL